MFRIDFDFLLWKNFSTKDQRCIWGHFDKGSTVFRQRFNGISTKVQRLRTEVEP